MRIIGLMLLIGLTACNSEPSFIPEESQIPADAVVQDYSSLPGLQRVMIKDGETIVGEGDFLNKKHHGSWTLYDSKGKVTRITTYLDGLKQGVELVFDNQGYVSTKGFYHNNQLEGEFLTYKRRNVIDRKNYIGGVLDGLQKKYYANGNIMEEVTYVQGKMDGVAKWYDQEGNLSIEYTYKNGERIKEEE